MTDRKKGCVDIYRHQIAKLRRQIWIFPFHAIITLDEYGGGISLDDHLPRQAVYHYMVVLLRSCVCGQGRHQNFSDIFENTFRCLKKSH